MQKKSMNNKLTNYEVGNFVLHRIGENFLEVARDCEDSHPELSQMFRQLGFSFCHFGQDMEETDITQPITKDSELYSVLKYKIEGAIKTIGKDINECELTDPQMYQRAQDYVADTVLADNESFIDGFVAGYDQALKDYPQSYQDIKNKKKR